MKLFMLISRFYYFSELFANKSHIGDKLSLRIMQIELYIQSSFVVDRTQVKYLSLKVSYLTKNTSRIPALVISDATLNKFMAVIGFARFHDVNQL